MFKKFTTLMLFITLLMATFIVWSPATPAEASTSSRWMGTFTGSEPTFDSPSCGDNNAYVEITINPSVSGFYYVNELSFSSPNGQQIQFDIYENSFNAASPATNWYDSVANIGSTNFSAGTTYIIVVSDACGGTPSGTEWDFVISGPAPLGGTHPIDNFEGTFDGTEPIFDSPECSPNSPYDVIGPYTPTVTGNYRYGDIGVSYDVEITIDVYENNFDPSNPFTNYVKGTSGNGWFNLVVGTDYYFVLAPYTCPTPNLGTWEFVMAGPGVLVAPGGAVPPAAGINVPNFGEVMITSEISQFGYGAPAGEPARNPDGSGLWLPHDFDGNGFDTYVVTGVTEVDGETWLSIFIGNEQWVWVPQSTVITIR